MSHTYSGLNAHTNNLEALQERMNWMFANAAMITEWARRTTQVGPAAERRRDAALRTMDSVIDIEREIFILRWGEIDSS